MDKLILGIESSCDETAVAVIKNGRQILSSVIVSQIDIHNKYGGVVPEIASRNHVFYIDKVTREALDNANVTLKDISAIGVTYGAGLVGSLLVGVSFAKALSYRHNIDLVKVNHIEAHISAGFLTDSELEPPFIALVVSGGHTMVVKVVGYTEYEILNSTHDDAVGEAFDKVARVLNLPYPGGPNLDRLSKGVEPKASFYKVPKVGNERFIISYSGLKTAVINHIHNLRQKNSEIDIPQISADFSFDAFNALTDYTILQARKCGLNNILVCGGVAANSVLRAMIQQKAQGIGAKVILPPLSLCGDNGAMVASNAYFNYIEGKNRADLTLNAHASL